MRAQHVVQLRGFDAAQGEGARFGNAHLPIAIDHQAQIGVNAAPHAQLHLVAHAQHIVARYRHALHRRVDATVKQVVAKKGQALPAGVFDKRLELGFLQRWQRHAQGVGIALAEFGGHGPDQA